MSSDWFKLSLDELSSFFLFVSLSEAMDAFVAAISVFDRRRYVSPDFGGSVAISNPFGQSKRVLLSVTDVVRFSPVELPPKCLNPTHVSESTRWYFRDLARRPVFSVGLFPANPSGSDFPTASSSRGHVNSVISLICSLSLLIFPCCMFIAL